MDSKSLMINDWVQGFIPDTCSQIALTTWYGRVVIFTREGQEIELNEEDIKPISLTVEILEKNGFNEDQWEFYDGFHFELTNDKGIAISVGGLWFVHELQHALRLCGLEKLANNFVV